MCEQRLEAIDTLLVDCLNWQEMASKTILEEALKDWRSKEDPGTRRWTAAFRDIRQQVKYVKKDANRKMAFLEDALIYSLCRHACVCVCGKQDCHCGSDVEFDYKSRIGEIVKNYRYYSRAVTVAKMFRAIMTTRYGVNGGEGDGMQWGGSFYYSYGSFLRIRDRRNVFFGGEESDAAKLARRLSKFTETLVTAVSHNNEVHAFRFRSDIRAFWRAVDGTRKLEAGDDNLLAVWERLDEEGGVTLKEDEEVEDEEVEGRKGELRQLPKDKLWNRGAYCVYAERCVSYGEFDGIVYKNKSKNLGQEKLNVLHKGENTLKNELEGRNPKEKIQYAGQDGHLIARNCWSRGFLKGRYWWRDMWTPDLRLTPSMENLKKDAIRLLEYIDKENLYEGVKESLGLVEEAKSIVQEACKGRHPGEIERICRCVGYKLFICLFLVAKESNKKKEDIGEGLKLGDFWVRESEAAPTVTVPGCTCLGRE